VGLGQGLVDAGLIGAERTAHPAATALSVRTAHYRRDDASAQPPEGGRLSGPSLVRPACPAEPSFRRQMSALYSSPPEPTSWQSKCSRSFRGDIKASRRYGIVGDSLNGIIEALRSRGTFEWVHVRHEEAAAFAAAGEAETVTPTRICVPYVLLTFGDASRPPVGAVIIEAPSMFQARMTAVTSSPVCPSTKMIAAVKPTPAPALPTETPEQLRHRAGK
jgi:hypothetical protein